MRPSATMFIIGRYATLRFLFFTSYLSQHYATLICKSLVDVLPSLNFRI